MKTSASTSINFLEVLSQKREIVWKEIEKYLDNDFASTVDKFSKGYKDVGNFHQQIVREYPERKGKYLRPSLVLLTCQAMGADPKKAVKTAAAMQISEDWILIHDDFEDDSLERRGNPTLHKIYGSEIAVNAGDALHVLMWKVLYDNTKILGQKSTSRLFDEFYQMLSRATLGQTVEIKWTNENKIDLEDKDFFFIVDGKTVYYTIAGPMRLGAIIAGATSAQLDALYEFGTYTGRCFQIKDDILDITSNFKGLKKQQGNDIYEGKRTLMLLHLLQNAKPADLKKLKSILAKSREEKSWEEVGWVIELMHEYGSINYARDVAEKLAKKAYKVFDKKLWFLKKEPARSQIRAGISFILERDH